MSEDNEVRRALLMLTGMLVGREILTEGMGQDIFELLGLDMRRYTEHLARATVYAADEFLIEVPPSFRDAVERLRQAIDDL